MTLSRALIVTLVLALGVPGGARAQAPLDAHSILQRMEARNPSLQTFEARVRVNVRMVNFPWLSPELDGTAYFKRPQAYELVFDRVPSYARGINKVFGAIGDPAAWEKDSNISLEGAQNVGGRPLLLLRMTKKIPSDQTKDAVAYVDPVSFAIVRMDWHYTNGGVITMTQTFRDQGQYSVIATQHAEIRIPHVHAVADASYGAYQTNIALADGVFQRR